MALSSYHRIKIHLSDAKGRGASKRSRRTRYFRVFLLVHNAKLEGLDELG